MAHYRSRRWLSWLAFLVVLVGVAWRLGRYLLAFPVWGDEAMLLLNYDGKGYLDLIGPLDNCQVAPLLFHWAELTAIRLFGTGTLAVRLPPLLACLGSLVLFWRLARLTLPLTARRFAVAILAMSIWPATLGSLVKPYTFDLFFALALMLLAAMWKRRPDRIAPLVGLMILVPVAIASSYPAVFVAAGLSISLLPIVWRQKRSKIWAIYLLFNLLLLAAFVAHYFLVAKPQMASMRDGLTTADEMRDYWQHGFPPTQPLAFVQWFVLAHTGQMVAYPIGAAAGGSIVTVLLCLIGARRLLRRRRWLLGMFASIFALCLLAALLRGYPYGASGRLAQHLAPVFCLLAGGGLGVLLSHRPRAQATAFVALALLGVGGMVRDGLRPYRDDESRWAQLVVEQVLAEAGEEVIVMTTPRHRLPPVLAWQLVRHGDRIRWHEDLPSEASTMWLLSGVPGGEERTGWVCVERRPCFLSPTLPREPIRYLGVARWVRYTAP